MLKDSSWLGEETQFLQRSASKAYYIGPLNWPIPNNNPDWITIRPVKNTFLIIALNVIFIPGNVTPCMR